MATGGKLKDFLATLMDVFAFNFVDRDNKSANKNKDDAQKAIDGVLNRFSSNQSYASSIRGRASRFVLQFPVISSTGVSEETIELLRNQIELERANDTILYLSNNPLVNYNPATDGFLGHIHNNINLGENVEGTPYEEPEEVDLVSNADLAAENIALLRPADETFVKESLNSYTLPKAFTLKEAETDLNDRASHNRNGGNASSSTLHPDDVYKDKYFDNKPGSASLEDLKKQNKMSPLIITAKVMWDRNLRTSDGRIARSADNHNQAIAAPVEATIKFGIKAVLHGVRPSDVVYFLSDDAAKANWLARFVRFTAGEIGFMELLFGIERLKRSAKNQIETGSKVWANLQAVSDLNKGRKLGANMSLVSTITMVTTIEEVQAVKHKTGVDLLSNRDFQKRVFENNLLSELMVVDEINGFVYRYMPDQGSFDKLRLKNLEATRMPSDKKKEDLSMDSLAKILGNRLGR